MKSKIHLLLTLSLLNSCNTNTNLYKSIRGNALGTTYSIIVETKSKEDLIEDYSSGMVKRSELAIADLKKPDILCIDEPKVYLDENGIQLLFDLLNYRETQKMSSILSSQESINALSNIERTIDLND